MIHRLLGTLLTYALSLSYAQALLLAPQGDPNAAIKYTVNYVSSCRWDTLIDAYSEANNGSIFQFGSDTQCLIPDAKKSGDARSDAQDAQDLQIMLAETLDLSVQILSSTLDGYCFLYNNGFWTYRYCPGNDLIQLHNDTSDPQTLIYTLGKSKPDVEDREFQLLYNDVGYYVSEIVGMGDICDVTGTPRLVEVQYVCGDAHGGATIQWIRETKTCQYELQITVPQLCALELLSKNEDKKNAVHLNCLRSEAPELNVNGNVIDVLAEYDPLFLGYGIYFLQPINEGHRTVLMYSGELDANNVTQETFDKFGKAFNRLINQRMLIAPNGEYIVNGDVFSWMAQVVDIQGREISMLSIYVSSNGKANLYMNDNMKFDGPGNFVMFQSKADSFQRVADDDDTVEEGDETNVDSNADTDAHSARFVVKLSEGKEIGVSVRLQDGKQYIALVALQEAANFELLNEYERQRIISFVFESAEVKSVLGDVDRDDFHLDAARYDDTVLFEYVSEDVSNGQSDKGLELGRGYDQPAGSVEEPHIDDTPEETIVTDSANTETVTSTVYETVTVRDSDNEKTYQPGVAGDEPQVAFNAEDDDEAVARETPDEAITHDEL
ncbi:Yos9 protein [Maudiozyma humilis]|uniref:Endoplasmic reticulum lectin n=1 Tax=Maudiozyma humilis TaxID=51915 RepID=A0AAV5S6G5_MAUHU|nr:Yos9 protein [Kazachstania humilis]